MRNKCHLIGGHESLYKFVKCLNSRYGFKVSQLRRSRSEESLSSTEFKARPFPKDIFTDFAYEKMKEDLAFRNVRKAIRQKEMLAAAKYPPRMADSILTVTRKKSSKKSDVSAFNIKTLLSPDPYSTQKF